MATNVIVTIRTTVTDEGTFYLVTDDAGGQDYECTSEVEAEGEASDRCYGYESFDGVRCTIERPLAVRR